MIFRTRYRLRPSAPRILLRHAVIWFFMFAILLPMAWVVLMSVKTRADAMRADFWPRSFDFSHYFYALTQIRTLPINLFNSLYVTAGTVLLTTLCAVPAGYALAHLSLRGRHLVIAALVASLYFPIRTVSVISIYETQHALGLINSTAGLILPYVSLNLAISVLVMRSMFQLVPHEIFDAAKIDGAGRWRTLWSIGLPMVRNGLVVVFMINFVAAWGEYLLCATLTNDQAARTIPVVLASAQGGVGQWSWPNLAAVYVIVILPGILAFSFMQKLFFKGLTEGALAG
jgi:ABC-type glycerol-3-phosphate transport system permease component